MWWKDAKVINRIYSHEMMKLWNLLRSHWKVYNYLSYYLSYCIDGTLYHDSLQTVHHYHSQIWRKSLLDHKEHECEDFYNLYSATVSTILQLQLQTPSLSKLEVVSLVEEKDTNIPSKPQSQGALTMNIRHWQIIAFLILHIVRKYLKILHVKIITRTGSGKWQYHTHKLHTYSTWWKHHNLRYFSNNNHLKNKH